MELIPLFCLLSLWAGCTSAQEIGPHNVVTVSEGDNALLPCALGSRQSIDKFDWVKDKEQKEKKEVFMYEKGPRYIHNALGQTEQFNNRVSYFQDELTSGNASIIIENTRLEDNGTYTCVLFEPRIQEFNIRLNVGAAPLPLINQIHVEDNRILLECKAQGVPKPEVVWRNSAGDSFPAKDTHVTEHKDASGRFHVQLQVKVSRSDSYTCVVTQRDIYHQRIRTVNVRNQDSVAVMEGNDAILPCFFDSKENIQNLEFSWRKDNDGVLFYDRGRVEEDDRFTGRLAVFQQELKSGDASIKIHNTQKSDSGQYTCYISNIQKSHIKLHIIERISPPEYTTGSFVAAMVLVSLLVIAIIAILYFARQHQSCCKG